ncbi:MAG: hypothetical protein NUV78_00490 [Candidatus Zambryskibacteria bacterium]|nr:hypothetical protein [Candidatus Zambryskibacteria bacterium]
MRKRQILLFFPLSILLIGVFFAAPKAQAGIFDISTLPFGGLVTYTMPCTCPSSAGNLIIWLAPLYFGAPYPSGGPLVYVPYITQVFPWYQVGVPGTWHLGSYFPGTSSACMMIAPPPLIGCLPFPALGVIYQVGTSKNF